MPDISIETRIKEKLRIKGMTFKELSFKIGMTEAGLYTSLKKNTIKYETLLRIAEALEVSILYFVESNITAIIDEDTNRFYSQIQELKKSLDEKNTIIEFLQQKDHANQDVIISILNLLSKMNTQPCKDALIEIKKIQKVQFLIEYGLVNPDIFK